MFLKSNSGQNTLKNPHNKQTEYYKWNLRFQIVPSREYYIIYTLQILLLYYTAMF